jgi:hypothetical protein
LDEQKPAAPPKPRSLRAAQRRAKSIIDQAGALQQGERMCRGKVKLRDADGNYLRDEAGAVQTRPCRNHAIKGGAVCQKHGGKAPQVRKKADQRLLAMVEPALVRLGELVHQTEHMPTALGAIRTVLERAGSNSIGALAKESGEKDTRPQIVIGIKVGGIATPSGVVVDAKQIQPEEGVIVRDNEDDA